MDYLDKYRQIILLHPAFDIKVRKKESFSVLMIKIKVYTGRIRLP
jgi:hypothetical protein